MKCSNVIKVTCVVIFPMQNPVSSRPPVTHYDVSHNVSVISNQLNTSYTNITIHRALPCHVYHIQVTPVNVLGPGAARATCEY